MRLRPLESRIAAVALALLVLGLAYVLLLHGWFVAPQLRISAQMRELRRQQHRYSALIAERPALEKRLAGLARGQAASHAFLAQSDPSAASAGLMQHVVAAVAAHKQDGGCDISQKMAVPDTDDTQRRYRKVSVNISLRCQMRPLAEVLYALETGHPDLFIGSFSAYRNPVPLPHGGLQPLEVQFTLSGYMRPDVTTASAHAGRGA